MNTIKSGESSENLENSEKQPGYKTYTDDLGSDIKNTLEPLKDDEVLLVDGEDKENDSLISYLFEEIDEQQSQRIQSGISHIIYSGKAGNLVIGDREEGSKGRDSAVGSAVFFDGLSFINDKQKDFFEKTKNKKLILCLSVAKQSTPAQEKTFVLQPKIVEIPGEGSLLMKGMGFEKQLSLDEFKEYMKKVS